MGKEGLITGKNDPILRLGMALIEADRAKKKRKENEKKKQAEDGDRKARKESREKLSKAAGKDYELQEANLILKDRDLEKGFSTKDIEGPPQRKKRKPLLSE